MTTPSPTPPFVVAVDAGGTATRVGCYALDGTPLARATGAAGAAHRGALPRGAGVVVVAGTGSMVLAIGPDGTKVGSGQFQHYAGAACHVAFDVVHQVLAGRAEPADGALVARVLEHWGAADVDALRRVLLQREDVARNDVERAFGSFAPVVTELADVFPLADRALRRLAEVTADGVLLLAPLLRDTPVAVSLAGSLALDPAFATRLDAALDVPGATPVRLLPPALDPLAGAGLLALRRLGVPLGAEVVQRLGSSG